MDSFDDLLAPSRSMLEDNPFSDPFARSSSPDPWANPYANQEEDIYASPFATATSGQNDPTTPTSPATDRRLRSLSSSTESTQEQTATTPSEPIPTPTPSDPLDSANLSDDEPVATPPKPSYVPTPRSPGFKESIGPSIESSLTEDKPVASKDPVTVAPTDVTEQVEHKEPEKETKDEDSGSTSVEEPFDKPTAEPTEPESRSRTPSQSDHQPKLASSQPTLSNTSETPTPSWGPLDGTSTRITQSFSDLSLEGGTNGNTGGWAATSEPEPWNNGQPVVSRMASEDDSDDDKPIGQTLNKRLSQQSNPGASPIQKQPSSNRTDLRPVFVITVDDPQKVGDPIRSFTMYTVHTRTTSPLFQKSAFSVLRRYSDFLWLYETLSNNNPGVVVPPVPEKSPFGRFDDQFVKQRRFALEKCIQKIANHPVLGKDPDLKLFLESDTFSLDIKHRKAELAHERGGLMASIGQSIAGPRFHESDEWFDRQKAYLDSLESQLRGLAKAIDMVAKQRSDQYAATLEFANSLTELASADVGKQLVSSLSGLADVERKAHDLQVTQSDQDMVTFMGTVDEYARLINSVRMAFSSRVRVYHSWRNAESDLQRIKINHEKNRAQGRIPTDRLGFSLSQIAEAERRAADAKLEFEQVSKLVKTEVARFEQERIEDFKDSLRAFLEGMISRQKELIGSWENYQQMLLKRAAAASGRQTITIGTPQPPVNSSG
ncbi:Vacuolar protein sorting-associated protein vps5 [Marasmius tenuissimus]|nr:Vacuolar protein sorting-associated protein vps5 [Marasmius tenuissimus]